MTSRDESSSVADLHTISPHIVVRDAVRASAWYQQAIGAEERSRVPTAEEKIFWIELRFSNTAVMICDEFPEIGLISPQSMNVSGTHTVLSILTDEIDAFWARAIDAGATVLHPLQDAHGYRHGHFTDPFGHRWSPAQLVEPAGTGS